jgi:hypothetical protein
MSSISWPSWPSGGSSVHVAGSRYHVAGSKYHVAGSRYLLLATLLLATCYLLPVPAHAAVTLVSFTATAGDGQVLLSWETATEINNAGFFIRRSTQEEGEYARVSPFIPSQGDGLIGATYSYLDEDAQNGTPYFYKLEAVDNDQNFEFHGPISATPGQTPTPSPTDTPAPTATTVLTATPTPTLTPTLTLTPTSILTLLPTPYSLPTLTSTPMPTATSASAPTSTPTPLSTRTPKPTGTRQPTLVPTLTDTPTIVPTSTATPTSLLTQDSTPAASTTVEPTLVSDVSGPSPSPVASATIIIPPTATFPPSISSPSPTSQPPSPTLSPRGSPTSSPGLALAQKQTRRGGDTERGGITLSPPLPLSVSDFLLSLVALGIAAALFVFTRPGRR